MSDVNVLPELSAVELRRLIGSRQVSPVELMEACIARIEALNPAVNAIAATDFERARLGARRAEEQVMRGEPLGLLHGLPLGVKDLQDTAGLLTTYGNVALRHHVPAADNALAYAVILNFYDGSTLLGSQSGGVYAAGTTAANITGAYASTTVDHVQVIVRAINGTNTTDSLPLLTTYTCGTNPAI